MHNKEFPHLARVTNNLSAELIRQVGENLTAFDVDVRIDYERWIQFQKEYGDWARNCDSIASRSETKKENENEF